MARKGFGGGVSKEGCSAEGSSTEGLSPATVAIERVIRAIPPGRVATYGQVARLAGLPNGARQVARVLHARSAAAALPWHRVVGSASRTAGAGALGRIALGRIALGGDGFDEQRALLESEGVRVGENGVLDLAAFGWAPS